MTDRQLSVEVERLVRLAGGLGIFRVFGRSMEVFMGSLLAGDNAAAPSPYDFALGGAGLDASLPVSASGSLIRPRAEHHGRHGRELLWLYGRHEPRLLRRPVAREGIRRPPDPALRYRTPSSPRHVRVQSVGDLYDLAVDICPPQRLCRLLHGRRPEGQVRGATA